MKNKPVEKQIKKQCKHTWTIIPYTPQSWTYVGGTTGGAGGGVFNDAIAVCIKCLEKRYL